MREEPFADRALRFMKASRSLAGLVTAALSAAGYAAFTDVTAETPFAMLEQLPMADLGAGVSDVVRGGTPAVIDFNGDGWLDVYVTRYGLEDVLMLNRNGVFERIDNPLGLSTADGGNVPAWADFNNNGLQDLFVAVVGEKRHKLYLNKGGGVFEEAAVARGVDLLSTENHMGSGVAVGDLDRDGYLDFVVGEWGVTVDESNQHEHFAIFLNRGDEAPGYFRNVTLASGVRLGLGGLSVYAPNISDLDDDGWPDLPLVADFERSQLFWNNGDGSFTDGTETAGVSIEENGMGTAIADVNRDGQLDWFVTSIRFTGYPGYRGNQLYINQGDRRFESVSDELDVATGGWGWGCDLFDFDNDGHLDIVMTNGTDEPAAQFQDPFEGMASMILWQNNGEGAFLKVSDIQGVDHAANGAGLVAFDYDNDGDLDLLVFHQGSAPILLRNDRVDGKRWLRVGLEGTESNRDGIGARVTVQVEEGGPEQVAEFNPSNAYLAQKEPYLHFGLGAGIEEVARLTVRWPTGAEQVLENVAANQVLKVVEAAEGTSDYEEPVFTQQPERLMLRPGETLQLTVEAEGVPEPVIRWYHNARLLPDATGPHLEIENVTPADAGKYYATASNAAGVAFSDHARVSVRDLHLDKSVARQWMEELLDAIRLDYPAPTVHSRNLFGLSAGMWDAWVAYDFEGEATPYLSEETPPFIAAGEARESARAEAVSYAAYRTLRSRFRLSPNAEIALPALRDRMLLLGYDPDEKTVLGDSPAAVGNRVAARLLAYTWNDGGNEPNGYVDQTGYASVNEPLIVELPGADAADPNRWQPLSFDYLILQNGIIVGESVQTFLGANWGSVRPFALERPSEAGIYSDPGPPPYLGGEGDEAYKQAALEVVEFGSWLDPSDGVEIDVSPGARHNNTLGSNDGEGYVRNPATGQAYESNVVLRADYARVLAEFWADGPDSETPPGHWNSVANYVADDERFEPRFEGQGDPLDRLEWDVKLYFALNAAVSDAAIACWDAKRKYDYARPITMIRYMGGRGQSTDPDGLSYDPEGLPLKGGLVEVVTEASSAPGQRHAHLAEHVGEVALRTWTGVPENPNLDFGGVGWILASQWMPYQRDTFVSPPFAGYTSGHSTFSRAAAEVLTAITGDPYFPGGISTFTAGADEFLEFERGPERDLTLTWATYFDAADEAGISRLYGGIHVSPDDLGGRVMGSQIGLDAYAKAKTYFVGTAETADWSAAMSAWALGRVNEPNGPAEVEELLADPFDALARFYFGSNPLGATNDGAGARALRDGIGRVNGIELVMEAAVIEPEIRLQVSQDLVTWTELAPSDCHLDREALGDQRVRVTIEAKAGRLPEGAKFLRVVARDQF